MSHDNMMKVLEHQIKVTGQSAQLNASWMVLLVESIIQ